MLPNSRFLIISAKSLLPYQGTFTGSGIRMWTFHGGHSFYPKYTLPASCWECISFSICGGDEDKLVNALLSSVKTSEALIHY